MLRIVSGQMVVRYKYITLVVLMVIMVSLLYTQPFTRSDILLCMIFIMLVFRMKIQDMKKAEEKYE